MSKLVDYINGLSVKENKGSCNEDSIRKAEQELGLVFSEEYKDLLLNFGTASLNYIDILSTINNDHYNVVSKTKELRSVFSNLDANLYVVVDAGVDGVYALQDKNGKIYEINGSDIMEAYDSLLDFIKDIEG